MLLGAFSGLDLGKKSILYIAVLKTKTSKAYRNSLLFLCGVLRVFFEGKKANSTGARRYTSGR